MRNFSDDIDLSRLIPARIASYSVSLLDAGNSSHMACSTLSPVRAFSCKPTPAPVWREAPSTLRIHQPLLSWTTSNWGSSARKSFNTFLLNAKRGLY